jgi:NADPH:quinone reductase-like Zn-dependent oxidoreductase
MKAVVITQPGAPEVLQIREREVPRPGDSEVLIKVYAAGVNRPDVFQRKGNYPPPPGAPQDIPGLEVAGVIEAWRLCVCITRGRRLRGVRARGGGALPARTREFQ